jgi:hypothetical protein
MKRDRRRSLRLERLEGKALLSAINAFQGAQAPGAAKPKAGPTGSVAIHSTALVVPTSGRPADSARTTSHPIHPLGKLQLGSLSTIVSAGGRFTPTGQFARRAVAARSVPTGGIVHAPIILSPRGVSESTSPVHVNSVPGQFSSSHAAAAGSVKVSGVLSGTPAASKLKTIGR